MMRKKPPGLAPKYEKVSPDGLQDRNDDVSDWREHEKEDYIYSVLDRIRRRNKKAATSNQKRRPAPAGKTVKTPFGASVLRGRWVLNSTNILPPRKFCLTDTSRFWLLAKKSSLRPSSTPRRGQSSLFASAAQNNTRVFFARLMGGSSTKILPPQNFV